MTGVQAVSDRLHRWSKPLAAAALAMFLAAPSRTGPSSVKATALWRVVHDLCVTDKKTIGLPAPCTAVDLRRGFALVKDAGGRTGYLLVPLTRLSGIEDPAILADGAPNYWQMAWEARGFVARKASRKLDRTDIAIAVNSVPGRSQNQLHFHFDCVRQDVKDALGSAHLMPEGAWAGLNLLGHPYRVTAITTEDLGPRNPFVLLAGSKQVTAKEMGEQTLVVVGAKLADGNGFYVIGGRVGPTGDGHGEELLDHRCKLRAR